MKAPRGAGLRPSALAAAALGAGLVFLLAALVSPAEDKPPAPVPSDAGAGALTETRVIERINAATDRALDWLAKKQIKQGENTGAWSTNQAFNAVAMLAFLSSGHTPGRGTYGDVIEDGALKPGVLTRGKKYMLDVASKIETASKQPNFKGPPAGYLTPGSMYEHGLATLCLAEMYGMDPDPDLEDRLRKAVDVILKSQSPAGGWRYAPSPPNDQDLSVTVMQVVALRAANNAGVPVPKATFDKAVQYVQAAALRGGDGKPVGGFGYQGPGNSPQTSAGGTLCLQLLGHYDDPAVAPTVAFLSTIPVRWGANDPQQNGKDRKGPPVQYFYYFHYYAIQAFYQAGGDDWNKWHPDVRELLLAHQDKDGSWDVPPGSLEAQYTQGDRVYPTAMATLILNIYRHYLPAYQR